MPKIFTPSNQLKLTNVAVVRLKKNGKRFEIACYKNKVLGWRNKTETDIDEVLHTNTVFTNVSKGLVANKDDLLKHFNAETLTDICKEILNKGEIQISDKERHLQQDKATADIVTVLSEQCVNIETQKPYAIDEIEQALKELHVSAKPHKAAEQQAFELIAQLNDKLPIKLAKLKVEIKFTIKDWKDLKQKVVRSCSEILDDTFEGNAVHIVAWIIPGRFKTIEDLIKISTKGSGIIQTLELKEIQINESE